MAVEYDISSDVAVIKETGSVSQCARVTQMYSGQITYDDEAGSKFATATINGKSQRVMLCIAVSGTVTYDDVPSLYSTVDGHRCLNIVTPTETGTPDDVPSLYETVVIDGQNVRAVRCIMINKTPVYDGVSSTCTFTGDDGKTHTAQLVNKITGGSVEVIIKGTSPLNLPDAIANSLSYVKAFGGTEQRDIPDNYLQRQFIYMMSGSYLLTDLVPTYDCKIEMDFQTTSISTLVDFFGGRTQTYGGIQLFAASGSRIFFVDAFGSTRYNSDVAAQNNTRYKFTYDNQVAKLESGGSTIFTNTFTGTDANTAELCINGLNSNGNIQNVGEMYLYSFKMWNGQGELVMNLVPAVQRGTVPVVGFYDTVSGTFKTATAGTFAAGGEAVPTPDAPMDIISNNGVIAFRDTKLPSAYRRILGMTMNDNCYYEITDFKMNGSDTLRFSFTRTGTNACNVLGAYDGTSAQTNYSLYVGTYSGVNYLRYNGGTYNSYAIADKKYEVVITPTGSGGMETDSTWTAKTFTSTGNLCIGTTSPSAASSKMVGSIHGTVVVDGRLELIPCERLSDGEIGYYDTYTETFFEPIGTTPTSLGYDYTHCGIVTSGPVETINAHGKNLFDVSDYDTLSDWAGGNYKYVEIPLPNGTYTVSWDKSKGASSFYWLVQVDGSAKGASNPGPGGSWLWHANIASLQKEKFTFTVTEGRVYFTCAFGATFTTDFLPALSTVQIELGSTATEYKPYYNGGTATAEMLLKVGDYQDVQSILDGVVTRNVGIKVFDGTKNWIVAAGADNAYLQASQLPGVKTNSPVLCSHLINSSTGVPRIQLTSVLRVFGIGTEWADKANFQSWLADQYNAGTPVIVIYPLATPTTESVTGQTLQVTDGDNVLEITQASLNGLELEAQYDAAVSLTIQEVQDANLDNNVTVTIQ